MLARVLLAQGEPGRALALLDRLHAAAAAQDRTGSLIEIGALRALALAASGEEDNAVTALAGTLTAGLPAGLCPGLRRRGPADGRAAGPAVAAQRAGQAAADIPLDYLARLQRAFAAGLRARIQAGTPPRCPASSIR